MEKTKSNLAHGKLQNAAELATMDTSFVVIRSKAIPMSALDKDDYTSEISNKVKLFASLFAGLP